MTIPGIYQSVPRQVKQSLSFGKKKNRCVSFYMYDVYFIWRTLAVPLLSVSQIWIKLFLMLVFPFVQISARINYRTDKVWM